MKSSRLQQHIFRRIIHQMRRRTIFYAVCLLALFVAATSCERLGKKWDARERRMNYLQHRVDSARTAHDAHNDSLRHAGQSAGQGNAQNAPKADPLHNAPRQNQQN